jgi:hypothetical protein
MRMLFLLIVLFCLPVAALAQQNVGINTTTPDSTAVLHLEATDKGFLPPRLTRTQRDAINNPATGLVIFNNTDSTFEYFNGTCWLPTHQENCDDCLFDLSLPLNAGNIDRVLLDTIAIAVNVTQTSSPAQTISFFAVHNLPQFTTSYFTIDTLTGNGSTQFVVHASIFDEPGLYPIAIQAVCNNTLQIEVFYLTIDSCYMVTVSSPVVQYDLQAVNSLPGVGTPICVVMDVFASGEFNSNSATVPSYTSGALDPQSHVGIRNYGFFFARGGDGATGGGLTTVGNPGQDGGNAIDLQCRTSLLNYGFIYGGGGGGASVGFGQTFNIPVIGNWTLGIGAGGGGGCADGIGGNTGAIPLPIWADGEDASGGLAGQPGDGGVLNVPIPIPAGPVTITITPNVEGGDGGGYGLPGTDGNLTIGVSVTVPIIGTITLPIPPITGFPLGGNGGYAIKRNGYPLSGAQDGNYQTASIRGQINN